MNSKFSRIAATLFCLASLCMVSGPIAAQEKPTFRLSPPDQEQGQDPVLVGILRVGTVMGGATLRINISSPDGYVKEGIMSVVVGDDVGYQLLKLHRIAPDTKVDEDGGVIKATLLPGPDHLIYKDKGVLNVRVTDAKPAFEMAQNPSIIDDRVFFSLNRIGSHPGGPRLTLSIASMNGRVVAREQSFIFLAHSPTGTLVLTLVGDVRTGDTLTATIKPGDGYIVNTAKDRAMVTVPAVANKRPMPMDDSPPAFSEGGGDATGNVLDNDTDPENDSLTVTRYSAGSQLGASSALAPASARGAWGSLTMTGGGAWTYRPDSRGHSIPAGDREQEVFTYEVSDGQAANNTAPATLTLTITGANDAPRLVNAIPTAPKATQDMAYEFRLPGGTFADPDRGDSLTYGAALVRGMTLANLPDWLKFDGSRFFGTPAKSDAGDLVIRVTATDRAGLSDFEDFDLAVVAILTPDIIDPTDSTDPPEPPEPPEPPGNTVMPTISLDATVGVTTSQVRFTLRSLDNTSGANVQVVVSSPNGYVTTNGTEVVMLAAGASEGHLTLDRSQTTVGAGDTVTATIQAMPTAYMMGSTTSASVSLTDAKPTFALGRVTADARNVTARLNRLGSNMAGVNVMVDVASPGSYVASGVMEVAFPANETQASLTLPIERGIGQGDRIVLTLVSDVAYLVSADGASGSLTLGGNEREVRRGLVGQALAGFARAVSWDITDAISHRSSRVGRSDRVIEADGLMQYLASRHGTGGNGAFSGGYGAFIGSGAFSGGYMIGNLAPAYDPVVRAAPSRSPDVSLWADGRHSDLAFGGDEDGDNSSSAHDGDMNSVRIGTEKSLGDNLTLGLVASAFDSTLDNSLGSRYGPVNFMGKLGMDIWSLNPYLIWRGDRGRVWATLGGGMGSLDYTDGYSHAGRPMMATDSSRMKMGMVAAGSSFNLVRASGHGNTEVLGRLEAMGMQLETDDARAGLYDKQRAKVSGARGELEFGWPLYGKKKHGGTSLVRPYMTVGYRWDEGDGEGGGAAEYGTGITMRSNDYTLAWSMRTQELADKTDLDRTSYSLSFSYDSHQDRQGLMLGLSQAQGAEKMDPFAGLLDVSRPRHLSGSTDADRISIQAGYGLLLDTGLLTLQTSTDLSRNTVFLQFEGSL